MKSFIFISLVILSLTCGLRGVSQSPGLTINVTMDSLTTTFMRYKIEMKICEPKKMTKHENWFSHDTSKINFDLLKAGEIICGQYFDYGIPTSPGKEEVQFNRFKFSGQVFAWEKIFVFKISDWSSRGWHPDMYVVLPVNYKSFVTHINLSGLEFREDQLIFLTAPEASYENKKLIINQSLKDHKTVEVKSFYLKEILERK